MTRTTGATDAGSSAKTVAPPLGMLILALTGACNFRCSYCYAAAQPACKIPREALRWALDLGGASGEPFTVQFTGGEPLLALDRLLYAVEYIRARKYRATLQIQTNASLLTPEIAAYFAKERIGVGISLDGDVEANDAARVYPDGKGTATSIMRGLEMLRDAGLGAGLTCVVGRHNIATLETLVDMAYYAGNVRRIGFDLLRPQGRADAAAAVSAAEMQAALQRVLRRADELATLAGYRIRFAHAERVEQLAAGRTQVFTHCYALSRRALFVGPTGDCYSCASLSGYPEFRIGSYRDGRDEKAEQAVAARLERTMARCRECEYLERCGGGCYARWMGMEDAYAAECVLKQMFIYRYEEKKKGVGV